jgi:hypothetical protein
MLLHKTNIMKDPQGLEFETEGVEIDIDGVPTDIVRIKWIGKSFENVANALKTDLSAAPPNKTMQATAWLAEYMKSGEPISVVQIEAAATAVGIKKSTLDKAYKKLCGKKAFKQSFSPGWFWQLDIAFLEHHTPVLVPNPAAMFHVEEASCD